jgi:NAD+ kinase
MKPDMKTIGIISNNEKLKAIEVAKDLYDRLTARGVKVLLPEEDYFPKKFGLSSVSKKVFSAKVDIILSVGGDGTFLRAAKYSFAGSIPVLGFNVGNLGFLTEIDTVNISETLEGLIQGKYHLEKRMLLKGYLFKNGCLVVDTALPSLALNEFAITRSMDEKVIRMEIVVNGKYIKRFAADGIIIATPTGSTAYSLSAGGPVVEPQAESIIITPICPHTLFSRSIILGKDRELEIRLSSGNRRDMFSVDGKTVPIDNPSEYILKVTRSEKYLNLVSFDPDAFFKVFKQKFIERI